MFVGHFAAAFVAKRVEPKVSLGTLVAAAMLPDLLWPVFSIAGLEYVAGKPEAVIGSLIFFSLLVAWGYWMNRVRPVQA